MNKGATDVEEEPEEQRRVAEDLVKEAMAVPGGMSQQMMRIPESLRAKRLEATTAQLATQSLGGLRCDARTLKKLEKHRSDYDQSE